MPENVFYFEIKPFPPVFEIKFTGFNRFNWKLYTHFMQCRVTKHYHPWHFHVFLYLYHYRMMKVSKYIYTCVFL